ncbi:hypothetical protein H7F15_16030 [Pontibacter sp. Tf4]|uniref:hypothetical protein n=1 Tax=Pontibacter sp. Tf4 TaxID=2761620 RepID=UPI0016292C01|nr:hypothetical protein [Pontibacter sp. Tf4]MBB6612554.1 hypothetical protein [Pontibacter sp. Tf4]
MKVLAIIILIIFASCSVSKKIINTNDLTITLSKTECGSYEVTNNGDLIGYVVKPFYLETDKKDVCITQFENSIKANYYDYYDKFYRTYWFVKNNVSDTLILVQMFSPRQVGLVPDWQCEEQEVDVYNKLNKNKDSSKYPPTFTYNCTKSRFKIIGDPD